MILEIIKINPLKNSRNGGSYLMIEMKDPETKKWYRTYACPGFRNYRRWRRVARVGNYIRIKNLLLKSDDIIDADSYPEIVDGQLAGSGSKYTMEELSKLGVFG